MMHCILAYMKHVVVREPCSHSYTPQQLESSILSFSANRQKKMPIQNKPAEEVLNELDLILDLGATEDGEEGFLWLFESFGKVVQLLLHQKTGSTDWEVHADHRCVGAVGSAECVINENVAQPANNENPMHLARIRLVVQRNPCLLTGSHCHLADSLCV